MESVETASTDEIIARRLRMVASIPGRGYLNVSLGMITDKPSRQFLHSLLFGRLRWRIGLKKKLTGSGVTDMGSRCQPNRVIQCSVAGRSVFLGPIRYSELRQFWEQNARISLA